MIPYFKFWASDWAGSRTVQQMSFAERGVYITLLVKQWRDGPFSEEDAAYELGVEHFSEVDSRLLRRCFKSTSGGLLQNERLEEERGLVADARERQRKGGKESARRRAEARKRQAASSEPEAASSSQRPETRDRVQSQRPETRGESEGDALPRGGADAPAARKKRTKFEVWYDEQSDHIDRCCAPLWVMGIMQAYLEERREATGGVKSEMGTPGTGRGWAQQARWLEELGQDTAQAVLVELEGNGYKRLKGALGAWESKQRVGQNGKAPTARDKAMQAAENVYNRAKEQGL